MSDDDDDNIYEVTLELEKNTEYGTNFIGPAGNWAGNWENLDECGTGLTLFYDRFK